MTYDVISADSHVIEPPDVWTDRVPAEYRDRAPRLVAEDETDRLVCDGTVMPGVGLLAGCYRGDGEVRWAGRWDEDVPRGAYDPDVRLADLAVDGVDAEVLFPTLGLRLYPIEDLDFQWALFRAYNTWLAETFCVPHKGRFLGIAMLNHVDVDLAVQELVRAKEIGLSGVMVPVEPDDEDPYWDRRFDPLWAAAIDHQMPVNLHLTTSTKRRISTNAPKLTSPGQRLQHGESIQPILLDMIHYGLFDRFPDLKIVSAENDAGWAAYLIESQNYNWHRLGNFSTDEGSAQEPGFYFRQNIRHTFMRDRAAILAREIIGTDTMMWGNDFPHLTSTWPRSKEALDTMFHDQPQDVRDAIVRDNVRALYQF